MDKYDVCAFGGWTRTGVWLQVLMIISTKDGPTDRSKGFSRRWISAVLRVCVGGLIKMPQDILRGSGP